MTCLFSDVLVTEGVVDFDFDLLGSGLLQDKHIHLIMQQLAREANVDGCLNFVTSENPDLNTCLLDIVDCPTHLILELVFNSRRANQIKVDLDQLSNLIDLFVFVD